MGVTELKLGEWIDIYENLDDDGHLSKSGQEKLKEMRHQIIGG